MGFMVIVDKPRSNQTHTTHIFNRKCSRKNRLIFTLIFSQLHHYCTIKELKIQKATQTMAYITWNGA